MKSNRISYEKKVFRYSHMSIVSIKVLIVKVKKFIFLLSRINSVNF